MAEYPKPEELVAKQRPAKVLLLTGGAHRLRRFHVTHGQWSLLAVPVKSGRWT